MSSSEEQLSNLEPKVDFIKNGFNEQPSVENKGQLGDTTKAAKFGSGGEIDQADMKQHLSNDEKNHLQASEEHRISTIQEKGPPKKEPSSSLKSIAMSNHERFTGKNKQYDYILNVLNDLPEHWVRKEMKLHVIVDRIDATWITRRVFEDIQRGLINAQFTVKEWNNLCDITLVMKIADALASFPAAVTAINPVYSFLLSDIKSELIFRRHKRIRQENQTY